MEMGMEMSMGKVDKGEDEGYRIFSSIPFRGCGGCSLKKLRRWKICRLFKGEQLCLMAIRNCCAGH